MWEKATWKDRIKLEGTRWDIVTDDGNWWHIRDTKHGFNTEVWLPSFWVALDLLIRLSPEDFGKELEDEI